MSSALLFDSDLILLSIIANKDVLKVSTVSLCAEVNLRNTQNLSPHLTRTSCVKAVNRKVY